MATPIAADQFTRFMAEMFNEQEIIGVSTVGQSFFGNPANNGSKTIYSPDSNVIDIDIMRGTELIAAMIPRGAISRPLRGAQKNTDTQNFTTFSRKFPLGEEMGDINVNELYKRHAGENPYMNRTMRDKLREKAMEHYMEHIRRFVRLFEVLSWSSLLTGTMPAILGTTNADLIYDFRRSATHTINVGTAWDAAGADILGDIDAACELVRQDGKENPNVIFLSGSAMDSLIKDSTVATLADNRRFELIQVSMENPVPQNLMPLIESGATPYGRIRTPRGYALWIFTYVDDYVDAAGDRVKYLPDGYALIARYGARCDRYFGPPEMLPPSSLKVQWFADRFGFNMMAPPMPPKIKNPAGIVTPGMFFVNAYESEDNRKVSISTQSAPIFATTQTDAFVTLTGLDTEES